MSTPPFEVNINFDEASSAWKQNKKKHNSSTYSYVCGKPLKKGGFCQNSASKNIHCHIHK